MGNKPKAGFGGIVGGIIGAVLVAGIAGTPFYLHAIESDDRAVQAAASDDVEVLRRVVINLDQHLAALADRYAARGDDKKLPSQVTDQIKAAHSEARSAIERLRTVSRGDRRGTSLLEVNRIQAIYQLTAGRMSANRASIEQEAGSTIHAAVFRKRAHKAQLQRELAANKANDPTKAIADLAAKIDGLAGQIAEREKQLSDLKPLVEKLAADIAEHEAAAAQAWAKAVEIEPALRVPGSTAETQYLKLTRKGREAEVQAAALRGGVSVESLGSPGGDAAEAGEEPAPADRGRSFDELSLRVRQAEESLQTSKEARQLLEFQKQQLAARAGESERQRAALQAGIAECDDQLGELLKEADAHAAAAKTANEEAMKSYKLAASAVQSAVQSAKARASSAGAQARAAGGAVDERLDLISKDGDLEASLLCLAGEIAYAMALTNAQQIESLKARALVDSLVSRQDEVDAAASDQISSLRQEAVNRLAEAMKSFESAEKLLGGVSVKTSGPTFAGANYVWQVQVGRAAVLLLHANLAAGADGTPDRELLDKAYELLTTVAKDREQSPLISTALDTLQYLQRTAR